MNFFHQPKPRRFNHVPIYYNEHRDRVEQIERRARQELAKEKDHSYNPESLRGAFSKSLQERQARHRNSLLLPTTIGTGAMAILLIILVLLLIYLLI